MATSSSPGGSSIPGFERSISRRNHVHVFRLTGVDDVDDEFRGFLREAYAVGEQRHVETRRQETRRQD
jgi:hypothetical protein